jgi:serine/threonine protein kinase
MDVSATSRTARRACQGDLKILDRAETDTSDILVAFRREAALLASISHPGLPRIHEVGESQGRPYLLMDLVHGTPLADLVAARALAVERVLTVALDVVGGAPRRRCGHRPARTPAAGGG